MVQKSCCLMRQSAAIAEQQNVGADVQGKTEHSGLGEQIHIFDECIERNSAELVDSLLLDRIFSFCRHRSNLNQEVSRQLELL